MCRGAAKLLGAKLVEDGIKKVLVVMGKAAARKTGAYDDVASSLKASGVDFEVFEGVRPNPELTSAVQAVEVIRRSRATSAPIEAIVALGGGSVIDCSKAIAMGAMLPESEPAESLWDFYIRKRTPTAALPIYAVELLSATGSGCDSGSVLQISWEVDRKRAFKAGFLAEMLYPRVNFIDPSYQIDLPPYNIFSGATDAIVHCLEVLVETQCPEDIEVSFETTMGVLRGLIATTDKLLKDPKDYNAHQNLSLGALRALDTTTYPLTYGGVWIAHFLEHALGCYNPAVFHGAGLSVTFPAYVETAAKRGQSIRAFNRIAREAFGVDVSPDETGDKGWRGLIEAFRAKTKSWGMPQTLSELFGRPVTDEDKAAFLEIFMHGPVCSEDFAREAYSLM